MQGYLFVLRLSHLFNYVTVPCRYYLRKRTPRFLVLEIVQLKKCWFFFGFFFSLMKVLLKVI